MRIDKIIKSTMDVEVEDDDEDESTTIVKLNR